MRLPFYLLPRLFSPFKAGFAQALISSISVLIVGLTVWLVLVFFSVTDAIEEIWVRQLTAIHGEIQIRPTPLFYQSSYFSIDSYSSALDFTNRSFRSRWEKGWESLYDPEIDPEYTASFEDKNLFFPEGGMRDLVGELKESIVKNVANAAERVSFYTLLPADLELSLSSFAEETLTLPVWLAALSPSHLDFSQRGDYASIYLPKSLEKKVALGCQGACSVNTLSLVGSNTFLQPVHVEGFFSPGVTGFGGRFAFVSDETLSLLKSYSSYPEETLPEGIQISLKNWRDAEKIAKEVLQSLKEKNLEHFFSVTPFSEEEAVRHFLDELKSQKTIFSLLAAVIILVSCSNIVSILVILVHDKRKEIAVIRALGGSLLDVFVLFAITGVLVGLVGLSGGVVLSSLTMHHITTLLGWIAEWQGEGFELMFNPGDIPAYLSSNAFFFTAEAVLISSFVASILPALYAASIRPAKLLKGP